MFAKVCSHCSVEKDLSFFSKNKNNKDGLQDECKKCNKDKLDFKTRSLDGIGKYIYKVQKQSSKKRGHNPPEYSLDEFEKWLFSQPIFYKIYDEWKESGYDRWLKPSVDRKDNSLPYSIDNIVLMTWKENSIKANADMRSGKLIHGTKPQRMISQWDNNNNIIAIYVSAREASRQTGINGGNIRNVSVKNKHRKAGGYFWRYVDDLRISLA